MKGDFTRGTHPDRKRGKRYRRVLVQQSRVLLDSDAAALVDSFDHELRQVTADLGCRLGSPDYGYLITPGRLLALFEHIDHVTAATGATAIRDYSRKYPEEPDGRYPSLRITGAAAVTIPLLEPISANIPAQIALWYRADSAVSITVTAGTTDNPLTLAAATAWTRVIADVTVSASTALSSITITGHANPVWIALCESVENRQTGPHFWAAPGRFHAEGWTPSLTTAAGYPAVSYPSADGFPASDVDLSGPAPLPSIVAYLETWERDITAAEDSGIREIALSRVDTTVRTEVIGQVKWALANTLTPAQLRTAFEQVAAPASSLVVSAPTTAPSSDPCALPITGGYTGADHRLYRFEVHAAGTALTARLKWSRDNASALFVVRDLSGATVTLDRESGLSGGDIVEVLSEVVDLGDTTRAVVTASGVTPAVRRTGVLVRLAALAADSQGRDRFEMHDVTTAATFAPSTDPVRYPNNELRLRRWDGIAVGQTVGTSVVAQIEDGIAVTLSGQFQPGEYWQFEARRGAQTETEWRTTPHGPERVIAPLALLDITGAPTEPMFLRAWLDDRFSSLCELDADDVAFDGDRVESDADTVQEAIEELYERDLGNCCDATLGPNGPTGDDTLRIMAAITATTFPNGGHLCLEPGVYDLHTPIVIDRDVAIRGCPEAVLYGRANAPLFHVTARGRLRIEQLILATGGGPTELVLLDGGGRLAAREIGFLNDTLTAIRMAGGTPVVVDNAPSNDPLIDPDNLPPREDLGVQIDLRDCVVLARRCIDVSYAPLVSAARCAFVFREIGIGAQQIDQLLVADCSFRDGATHLWQPVAPELLRARTDEILDAVSALPIGNGTAIAVEYLFGGILERNHARSRSYLWSRVARDLSSHDDEHERTGSDGPVGFRIHHARRVHLESARLTADRAIDFPLSARQVQVLGCRLVANTAGVIIANDNPDLANAGSIVGVHVVGNHITVGAAGVSIAANGTKTGEVDDVRIADNIIRLTSNLPSAVGIVAVADQSLLDAIVIDGNDITSNQLAIQVSGVGMVVRGNQIRITSAGPAIGTITRAPLGQLSVIDNHIVGASVSFTAIRMDGVPDARVTGNQVRMSVADAIFQHPIALELVGPASGLRQYVANNDFAIGGVNVKNAHELTLVSNTARALTVDSGEKGRNGVVHGNKLGSLFIFSGSLRVRGMWKISDNLAPAIFSVTGATHQERIFWTDGLFEVSEMAKYRDLFANVSAATPAGGGFTMNTPNAVGAAQPASFPALTPSYGTPPPYSLAGTAASLSRIDNDALEEVYRPLRDFVLEHDVLLAARTVPDPLDAHISSNRVGWLIVTTPSTEPPSGSTIHVVDNKVSYSIDLTPFVPAQRGCIVSLNSITGGHSNVQFLPATYSTTSSFANHNVEI
ncbi:MAG: DUF6519 domain-containing protein [Kofleriaceae bacterium]